jgi:hypothetical protein
LTDRNIINKIDKFGISIPFQFLEPTAILSLFFGDFGTNGQNYITNNFINGYPETDPDILNTQFLDIFTINNKTKFALSASYLYITLKGISRKLEHVNILSYTENILDFVNSRDGLLINNQMLNTKIDYIPIKGRSLFETDITMGLIESMFKS